MLKRSSAATRARILTLTVAGALAFLLVAGASGQDVAPALAAAPSVQDSKATISDGQRIFRFETFDDEEFWTDKARMHEVVQQSLSAAMALKVGLKVDADAIPPDVAAAIKRQSRSRAPPRP
jgi:hypothetical protein